MPEWYKWCYKNLGGAQYAPLFGSCMISGGKPNYKQLYEKLKSFKEDTLAELVLKDEYDYFHREWIFYIGGARDNAERF